MNGLPVLKLFQLSNADNMSAKMIYRTDNALPEYLDVLIFANISSFEANIFSRLHSNHELLLYIRLLSANTEDMIAKHLIMFNISFCLRNTLVTCMYKM